MKLYVLTVDSLLLSFLLSFFVLNEEPGKAAKSYIGAEYRALKGLGLAPGDKQSAALRLRVTATLSFLPTVSCLWFRPLAALPQRDFA